MKEKILVFIAMLFVLFFAIKMDASAESSDLYTIPINHTGSTGSENAYVIPVMFEYEIPTAPNMPVVTFGSVPNITLDSQGFGISEVRHCVVINGVEYEVVDWLQLTDADGFPPNMYYRIYFNLFCNGSGWASATYTISGDLTYRFFDEIPTDAIATNNKLLYYLLNNLNTYMPGMFNYIASINSRTELANNYLSSINSRLFVVQDNIIAKLTDFHTALVQQLTNWQNALETRLLDIQNFIASINSNVRTIMNRFDITLSSFSNTMVDKFDELKETLTQSYDATDTDKTLTEVDTTITDMETAQKDITDGAVKNLDSFTIPSDGFQSFGTGFTNAISLCSGMLQSIYVSSGNLNIILSVTFIMIIATMITGLFRYYK